MPYDVIIEFRIIITILILEKINRIRQDHRLLVFKWWV